MWYHLHVESKNVTQMNLPKKQKQTHSLEKTDFWCQEGGQVEEGWSRSLGLSDADWYM